MQCVDVGLEDTDALDEPVDLHGRIGMSCAGGLQFDTQVIGVMLEGRTGPSQLVTLARDLVTFPRDLVTLARDLVTLVRCHVAFGRRSFGIVRGKTPLVSKAQHRCSHPAIGQRTRRRSAV